jgi:uncharacterized protein
MDDQGESDNVQDVRSSSGGGFRPIHGFGIGSVVIACIAGLIFHVNPLQLLGLMSSDQSVPATESAQPAPSPPASDPQAKFVSQVLKSTETVWTKAFQERGLTYTDPKLRLFLDSYPTASGQGTAAAGPFYCGEDQVVYLDLGFFDVMTQQLGAPAQFAHAYVIGHEVGHHVQNLLGILGKITHGAKAVARRKRTRSVCASPRVARLRFFIYGTEIIILPICSLFSM